MLGVTPPRDHGSAVTSFEVREKYNTRGQTELGFMLEVSLSIISLGRYLSAMSKG